MNSKHLFFLSIGVCFFTLGIALTLKESGMDEIKAVRVSCENVPVRIIPYFTDTPSRTPTPLMNTKLKKTNYTRPFVYRYLEGNEIKEQIVFVDQLGQPIACPSCIPIEIDVRKPFQIYGVPVRFIGMETPTPTPTPTPFPIEKLLKQIKIKTEVKNENPN